MTMRSGQLELGDVRGCKGAAARTVALDFAVRALNDLAEVRPFGQVVEIEADVVGLGERVEIALVELEEVHRRHRPDGRHGWQQARAAVVGDAKRCVSGCGGFLAGEIGDTAREL